MTQVALGLRMSSTPEVESQRRRAFRTLLRNPLLYADGENAEDYLRVRRHSVWLKQWLTRFPAWSLHIDGQVARLRKMPADLLDNTRPAIDRPSGTAFTKRRYALLCLTLAVLEQCDRQTTLGQIAQGIAELVAADRDLQSAGLFFDPGNYDHRRDLVHAVRFLADTGALHRLDGDERQFQDRNDAADVLYDINRHVLAALLQGSRSASAIEASLQHSRGNSTAERAERLRDHPVPASEDGRREWIRSRLVRTLLDDPILYFHDLDDEERQYLEKHRGSLLREICEATGLIAEIRREGIALVDDVGDLTDLKVPDASAGPEQRLAGPICLLLLQWFATFPAEPAGNGAAAAIPIPTVEEYVRELIRIHAFAGQDEACKAGAETRLTQDALSSLRALRLIQLGAGGVVPLAAVGRYAKDVESL